MNYTSMIVLHTVAMFAIYSFCLYFHMYQNSLRFGLLAFIFQFFFRRIFLLGTGDTIIKNHISNETLGENTPYNVESNVFYLHAGNLVHTTEQTMKEQA